ncbi:hypothetical protein F183_A21040 [Bryobacterales bacterium F-183]|nr:hypothetical protein F183_A21040 [Bryobacterales bacterium F-183]
MSPLNLTELLRRWRGTRRVRNKEAANELFEIIYKDLVSIASHMPRTQDLDAQDVVHKLFLKWQGDAALKDWNSRKEFFSFARTAMKRLCIDEYRKKRRVRTHLPFDEALNQAASSLTVVNIDELLGEIGKTNAVYEEVLTLKIFSKSNDEEIAKMLDVSEATSKRYYAAAKVSFSKLLQKNSSLT